MTTRKGYRFGVRWIAENDEPNSLAIDEVSGYISTLLLADLFGKEPERVAEDIVRFRADALRPSRQGVRA